VDLPRVGDRLSQVRDPADPGHQPLDPHAESRVRDRSVLAHVQIPLEGVGRQIVLPNAAATLPLTTPLPERLSPTPSDTPLAAESVPPETVVSTPRFAKPIDSKVTVLAPTVSDPSKLNPAKLLVSPIVRSPAGVMAEEG